MSTPTPTPTLNIRDLQRIFATTWHERHLKVDLIIDTLYLYHVQGYTQKQAALELGVSSGRVGQVLRRGERMLRWYYRRMSDADKAKIRAYPSMRARLVCP